MCYSYTLMYSQSPSLAESFLLTFYLNKFFYFRVVIDLQKNLKDHIESSHIPHTQLPLLLTFYISLVHFSQLRKPILVHYY